MKKLLFTISILFFYNTNAQKIANIEQFDCSLQTENSLLYLNVPKIKDSIENYITSSLSENLHLNLNNKDIQINFRNTDEKRHTTTSFAEHENNSSITKIYIKIFSGNVVQLKESQPSDSLKKFINPKTLSYWFIAEIVDGSTKIKNSIHYYINTRETNILGIKTREYGIAPNDFLIVCKHAFYSILNTQLKNTRVYRLNLKSAYFLNEKDTTQIKSFVKHNFKPIVKKTNIDKTKHPMSQYSNYYTSYNYFHTNSPKTYLNTERYFQFGNDSSNYFRLAQPVYHLIDKNEKSKNAVFAKAIRNHKQNSSGRYIYLLLKQDCRDIINNKTYQIISLVASSTEDNTYMHYVEGMVNFLLYNSDTICKFEYQELNRLKVVDNILYDGIDKNDTITLNDGNTLIENDKYIKTSGKLLGNFFEINNLKNKKEIYIDNKITAIVNGGLMPTSLTVLNNSISFEQLRPILFLISYPIPVSSLPLTPFYFPEFNDEKSISNSFQNYDEVFEL